MAKYRILSLDGGGLRGLITARLLAPAQCPPAGGGVAENGGPVCRHLHRRHPGAGPGLWQDARGNLHRLQGARRRHLDDSFWDNMRDLGKTVGADYSSKGLKTELKAVFGDLKLRDLARKVAIPTFDLDNEEVPAKRTWKPKIFHNFQGDDSDGEQLVANIARYTSSAPTYFPSADGYIDGGVYANNPSIVALAQAISSRNQPAERAALHEWCCCRWARV